MNILIVGSGIGGLTVAYWLHQYGFRVSVIEKVAEYRPIGSLALMREDGFRVAERMKIVAALQNKSVHLKKQVIHSARQQILRTLDLKPSFQEGSTLQLRRSDWIEILYQVVSERVPIQFQTALQSIHETSEGVEVVFSDGTSSVYDLVIGADGIHSFVRSHMFEISSLHPLGLRAMTFILEDAHALVETLHFLPSSMNEWYLPAGYVSLLLLSESAVGGIFLYRTQPAGSISVEERKSLLIERFAPADPAIKTVLDAIPDPSLIYADDLAQVIVPTWHKGHFVLVGDAAHATTPILGIGGSKAMFGAYILAHELATTSSYSEAFTRYEQKMRVPITQVQQKSRSVGAFMTAEGRLPLEGKRLLFKYAPASFLRYIRRPTPQNILLEEV